MRLTWFRTELHREGAPAPRKWKRSPRERAGPRRDLSGQHPESEGQVAPGSRPGPHLPGEAAAGPAPRRVSRAPAPGRPRAARRGQEPEGRNPGPEVSARRRQARQGPSSGGSPGSREPVAAVRVPRARSRPRPGPSEPPAAAAPAPAPARALPQPGSRFTHLAPPPRLLHVPLRPRGLGPSSAGAGGRRRPCSDAAAGFVAGRRQRTCCAACHGRPGSAAPPQPHNNMAAAASAGSRGAGREATGRAADGPPASPPARCGAPAPHPREPETGWGAAPRRRAPGPHPLGLARAPRLPSGRPRSPGPAARQGAAATHLAPPPRGREPASISLPSLDQRPLRSWLRDLVPFTRVLFLKEVPSPWWDKARHLEFPVCFILS